MFASREVLEAAGASSRGTAPHLYLISVHSCRRVSRHTALRFFRTYVGLYKHKFGVKRPTYLPSYPHAMASGRKTYLPTYLPIQAAPRKTYLPTYLMQN